MAMNNVSKMVQVPLGTPADKVLKRWGKPLRVKGLGEDKDKRAVMASGVKSYAVEWEYPWGFLVFKRRRHGGAHCYRVVEKRAKENHHG